MSGWAAGDLIQHVEIACLVKSCMGEDVTIKSKDVDYWGVHVLLQRNNQAYGSLILALFPDRKASAERLEKLSLSSPVPPRPDLGGNIGDRAAGWPQGTIVFLRDNAFVYVELPDKERCRLAASKTDEALKQGTFFVLRAEKILVPRISKIESPTEANAGTRIEVRIHVAEPSSISSDFLALADTMFGAGTLHGIQNEEREIVYTMHLPVGADPGKPARETYWICYANNGCMVVTERITVAVKR